MALSEYDQADLDHTLEVYEEIKRRGVPESDAATLTLAATCRSMDIAVNGILSRIDPPMPDEEDDDFLEGHSEPFSGLKN